MGIFGIVIFLAICWLLSDARNQISWRVVGWGLALQLVLALLVLGIPALQIPGILQPLFALLARAVNALLSLSAEGTQFVFGDLARPEKFGFIFAVQVLMVIPFVASLMALLSHWGVLQRIVYWLGMLMQKTMKVSGAESLAVAANVFLGQTEAPLVIRPYLAKMTRSELFCVMVGGFATVAGAVLAAYVGVLRDIVPNIAEHLITASVMSAPAALLIAKILIPETETPQTTGVTTVHTEVTSVNSIDALAIGAREGLFLAFNVATMLLCFISVVALVNSLLAHVGQWIAFPSWGVTLVPDGTEAQLNLQTILGLVCAPLAWLMGIPWSEAVVAGSVIGEKTVLNEFVAYLSLVELKESLSPRSLVILSYALCGFANFASIGILIGGISSLIPERQHDIARLGLRALLGGTLAAFITAAVASLFI